MAGGDATAGAPYPTYSPSWRSSSRGRSRRWRLRRWGRPLAALTPMHEALDGALGWDALRIARAYLNRELAESREGGARTGR